MKIVNYKEYKKRARFKQFAHGVDVNMHHNGFSILWEGETDLGEKSMDIINDMLKLRKISKGLIVYRRCSASSWRIPYIQIFYKGEE